MFAVALPSGDAPPADQFRDLAPGCFNRQIGIARIENNGLLQKILARMYYDVSRFCRREPAPQPVELDETTSAEVSFGTASASLAPGTYLGQACLGATGTWKGRECSTPVRLTVLERPQQLTPEQEIAIARRTGRYGLRAGDLQALETAGQRLLAADPGSIPGHMYVGEAKFRQGNGRTPFASSRPRARSPSGGIRTYWITLWRWTCASLRYSTSWERDSRCPICSPPPVARADYLARIHAVQDYINQPCARHARQRWAPLPPAFPPHLPRAYQHVHHVEVTLVPTLIREQP